MIDGQEGDFSFLMAARTAGDGSPSHHSSSSGQNRSGFFASSQTDEPSSSPHNASGQRPGQFHYSSAATQAIRLSRSETSLIDWQLPDHDSNSLAPAKKSRPDPADPAKLFLFL